MPSMMARKLPRKRGPVGRLNDEACSAGRRAVTAELLHVVVASFRSDAEAAERDRAAALAGELTHAEGVVAAAAARSRTVLIAAAWLEARERLEAFASAPEHMRFVIEGVARATSGMWSASIATPAASLPPPEARALWAFALPADPPAFEWQVQDLLAGIAALPAERGALAAYAGPTFEERERFRAGGLVLAPDEDAGALEARLDEARAGWGPLADRLVTACAPIVALTARAGSGR